MPPMDAAKSLQGNRARPRAVVPAIPLPYIQKRKQAVAAKAGPVEHVVVALPVAEPEVKVPVRSVGSMSPPIVNGSSIVEADTTTNASTDAAEENAPATPATTVGGDEVKSSPNEPQDTPASTTEDSSQKQSVSTPSDTQSFGSRSTYNMPPPFVPASQSQGYQTAPAVVDPVRFPRHPSSGGPHMMHHAHPSAGSLVFGGYPDSNNSSPAPHSAGGMPPFPPPGYPDAGRAQMGLHANGHMHSYSNGFAPMGPSGPGFQPRHDAYHPSATDNFNRRQMVSFAGPDSYSPSGTPVIVDSQRFQQFYEASTPHSFHGSQSSLPNEQDNSGTVFYNQHALTAMPNGTNGHQDDVRLYQQPRPKGRTGSQNLAGPPGAYPQGNGLQPPMLHAVDNLDGLIGYLQSQFADPHFADYTLELRYSDDRATPVRIPGHNLLFARSPALKRLMTAQARESNTDGLALRTLLIETDDRFLRSDGFWLAVNRLYGGPLLDSGATLTPTVSAQMPSNAPGNAQDRFDLALGYAAAGHILQMPPVITRGIEVASHFVNWQTLEKAFDFALDGGLDSQWTLDNNYNSVCPSTYGPAVNILLHTALNFMVSNFPPNFELDASVADPVTNRRIPFVMDVQPALSNPRLISIKFGDHPTEETARSNSNSIVSIISRTLINLPFPLLKYVLESSDLGNVQGWATTSLRQKVMHTVIEEREKRRHGAKNSKTVPNAERAARSKEWEAVGWEESVLSAVSPNEASKLVRTWVDFNLPG